MLKTGTKAFNFYHFCQIIQKFDLITHQLNWCYWKKKICSFQFRERRLSILLSWKIMSIWILKNEKKSRLFIILPPFSRIQILIIFHPSKIERWGLQHWKEQIFFFQKCQPNRCIMRTKFWIIQQKSWKLRILMLVFLIVSSIAYFSVLLS